MVRRWWVVAGVSLGAVGIALVVGLVVRTQVGVGNTGSRDQGAPFVSIAQRVRARVAEVSTESLAESIANLVQPGPYSWSGSRCQILVFPLRPEEGQEAVETILSNEWFLRAYRELSAMRPQEAAAVLNEALPVCLESYRIALDAYTAECADRAQPGVPIGEQVGPGLRALRPRDGRPNPLGERQGLLALALIAGNLGLDGAREAVEQVVAEALAQRERFYRDDEFNESFRFGMLTDASLYNRQILAHALLGTSPDKAGSIQVLKTLGLQAQTRELLAYDAVRTAADAQLMPGPVDYSKGVMTVEYLPPITDDEFDTIIAAVLPVEGEPAEDEQAQ